MSNILPYRREEYLERPLPSDASAEQIILAAVLLDNLMMAQAAEKLKEKDFYSPLHRRVFAAMMTLYQTNRQIDPITIGDIMQKESSLDSIGGTTTITSLTFGMPHFSDIGEYIDIVRKHSLARQLLTVCNMTTSNILSRDTDVIDVVDLHEQLIFELRTEQDKTGWQHIGPAASSVMADQEAIIRGDLDVPKIPTGFPDLDNLLDGLHKTDLVIIAGRPSMGKCLGRGTKVLMFNGSLKNVEHIRIGDELMGPDSKPRTVLSTGQGREMMYWIHQTYGISYRVNESHILSLKQSRNVSESEPKGSIRNFSVADVKNASDYFFKNWKGYKSAVDFPEEPLPVNPYFLGVWLGDGDSSSSTITTSDPEIVTYLRQFAHQRGESLTVNTKGTCPRYRVTGGRSHNACAGSVQTELRNIGVLNNKHIPHDYLINSKRHRLMLLAGLIDSDGHYTVGQNGPFEITTKEEFLAHQIKFLCNSLGYRTSLTPKTAKCQNGYTCTVYRVRFNGNIDEIPTKIPRKQARRVSRDWTLTPIRIEEDIVDDFYGFELDGDGLFLLEDMTVTHNTSFALTLVLNAVKFQNYVIAVFTLEMSIPQIAKRMMLMDSRVNSHAFKRGFLQDSERAKLMDTIHQFQSRGIHFDDTVGITPMQIKAKARMLKQRYGRLDLVVIDYIQLMTHHKKSESRQQEVSSISRDLKSLGKELDVPVVALSQLSRAPEARKPPRPLMSDLRESGSIEQDADVVGFMYRPAYYTETEENKLKAEIIIAKNRNGPTGTANLAWIKEFTRFENLDHHQPGF